MARRPARLFDPLPCAHPLLGIVQRRSPDRSLRAVLTDILLDDLFHQQWHHRGVRQRRRRRLLPNARLVSGEGRFCCCCVQWRTWQCYAKILMTDACYDRGNTFRPYIFSEYWGSLTQHRLYACHSCFTVYFFVCLGHGFLRRVALSASIQVCFSLNKA